MQLAHDQLTRPLVNSLCLITPPHSHCLIFSYTHLLPGECLSEAQPYRDKNQGSLCALLPGAMPSHRTIPDYFNHRALGIRPRSRFWLARVTGYPKPDHRRTASGRPKVKTPESLSVVLALGRAAAWRLNSRQTPHQLPCKTTQKPAGVYPRVQNAQLPHWTVSILVMFFRLSMPLQTSRVLRP